MSTIVEIDQDLKISLTNIKETVLFKPFERVSLEVMDKDTVIIHRESREDPFLNAIRNPAHSKEKYSIKDIETMKEELWSNCR
jgi:hypothetical protein